jgi:hypothetical protein
MQRTSGSPPHGTSTNKEEEEGRGGIDDEHTEIPTTVVEK